jgi:hypothetical protein
MLDKIRQAWTDFRYGSFFGWTVAAVVLGVLAFGLFLLDQARPKPAPVVPQTTQQPTNSFVKNFASAANLERISSTEINPGFLNFNSENKPIITTSELKITLANSVFQSKDSFLPTTSYYLNSNKLLINQNQNSFILDMNTGNTEALPESIYSVAKVSEDKYVYIQKREKGIAVKEAQDLSFAQVKTVGEQEFSKFTPDDLEVRVLNGKPFLFSSFEENNNSKLTIYAIGDKLEKKLEVQNVFASTFGFDKVLLSTTDGNAIDNQILLFGSSDKITSKELSVSRDLGQDQIFGSIVASRCTFSNGENKLVCAVKTAQGSNYLIPTEADSLVEIDFENNAFRNLLPNVPISISRVYQSPANEVYLVGQENNVLYKLKS